MTHPQQVASSIDNSLTALLQKGPARQRCIQRVAENLSDIQQARLLGHTWDAIAQAIDMRRPTLINAYNTLLIRRGTHRTEAVVATASRPVNQASIQPATALTSGIVALGRTNPNKFNI